MRLATALFDGASRVGVVEESEIAFPPSATAPDSVLAVIRDGADTVGVIDGSWTRRPLSSVTLLAPIPRPTRDIICIGKNYRAHAEEFHGSGFDSSSRETLPPAPVVFTKATTSVIGPDAEIRADLDPTGSTDYEGELGVVIGVGGRGISPGDALSHVFGYTVVNDVTSRELQRTHGQWYVGKSIDTFCPVGPWIVTADEIGDPESLRLTVTVNGEPRQDAVVSQLLFDIPTLISTISRTTTLVPGDIIATGTPAGVGIGMEPAKYLVDGDVVVVDIDRIGWLRNAVVG